MLDLHLECVGENVDMCVCDIICVSGVGDVRGVESGSGSGDVLCTRPPTRVKRIAFSSSFDV